MRTQTKILIYPTVLLALAFLIHGPVKNIARTHVNSKTGVNDHPLLCTSCHLYISHNPVIRYITTAEYVSPFNMAVSADGKMIYVISQDKDELLLINPINRKIVKAIGTGHHPHSVIVNREGTMAYVSNQWSDNISVIDLGKGIVTDTLKTAGGPAGLSFSSDQKSLYVVNSYSSDISIIDPVTGEEKNRLTAGNNPTGACLTPDGRSLYVTSRRAIIAPYGQKLASEMTVLDDSTQRISERINIESAYLIENIDFTPAGDLAFFTMVRPKNMVPSIQVEQGFMMNHGFGVIERKTGKVVQLLIDEPNAYYADPFDIVVSKDGKKAFISSSGVDCISVVDIDSVRTILNTEPGERLNSLADNLGISSRYIIKRIHTGANPKGLAISPDGSLLYVAEHLQDRIAIVNTGTLEIIDNLDLDGPRGITITRHGEQLMNNAGHTFQTQYSCYTCHPDGHEDGLVYNMASKDMGRNVTNTQSLRDISRTSPFKWNGKNQTVYKQDGIRFSTVLTRTEPFSYKDLDAITAYIMTGIDYPPNLQYNPDGNLTEAQLKGKTFFERSKDKSGRTIPENNRCVTCHPAPYYTNRQLADVSTLAASDDSMKFDTPHLNNIYASPPYLHDGRAATLEEIWTVYGTNDKHGYVSDLTKMELNDLVEYLKSLRSPEYEKK